MKLTKTKLQQIIQEEFQETLNEMNIRQRGAQFARWASKATRPITGRLRTTIPDNPRIKPEQELPPVVPQDLGPEDEPTHDSSDNYPRQKFSAEEFDWAKKLYVEKLYEKAERSYKPPSPEEMKKIFSYGHEGTPQPVDAYKVFAQQEGGNFRHNLAVRELVFLMKDQYKQEWHRQGKRGQRNPPTQAPLNVGKALKIIHDTWDEALQLGTDVGQQGPFAPD